MPSNIERVEVQCDQQNPAPSIAEDELPKYPRACPVPACEGKISQKYHDFLRHWNLTHERIIRLRKCLISGKTIDGRIRCHRNLHRLNKELITEVFIPNDSYIDPGTIIPCFHVKKQLQNMGTEKTFKSLVGDGLEVKKELKFDIADRETELLDSLNITDRETKEHLPDREPELAAASCSRLTETTENLPDREPELAVTSNVIVRDSAGRYSNYCISLYTRINRAT